MNTYVLTAEKLILKAKEISKMNTVYCWGSFGFPIDDYNINRLHAGYKSIYTETEQNKLRALKDKHYFGFDCVGLIKGILWGFKGTLDPNGGSKYESNGVKDMDCNDMFDTCSNKSVNFSDIVPGEFLWRQGHIGIYIGDGLGIEATPSWKNGVQITAVGNIGAKTGYSTRQWTKHGRSKFIRYSNSDSKDSQPGNTKKNNDIYQSLGHAAIRPKPSRDSGQNGRCEKDLLYVSDLIETNGDQDWFRHTGKTLYSAITDVDGSYLFKKVGEWSKGTVNATVKIRTAPSLKANFINKFNKGNTVYSTGKKTTKDGIEWVEIIFNNSLYWCDSKWIDF